MAPVRLLALRMEDELPVQVTHIPGITRVRYLTGRFDDT